MSNESSAPQSKDDSHEASKPVLTVQTGQARLMSMLGVASLVAAAGLALAPRLAPQVAGVTRELTSLGVSAGLCGALGLVLLALSWVRRAQTQIQLLAFELRENTTLLEGITVDVTEVGRCVESVKADGKNVAERVQGLSKLIENQLESLRSEAAQRDPHDAIFKLASSVDRLGARFEERFLANQEALEKSAHQWRDALDDLRESMEVIERLVRTPIRESQTEEEGGFEMLDRLDDQVQRESQAATLEAVASEAEAALDASWLQEHTPSLTNPPQAGHTNFTRRA